MLEDMATTVGHESIVSWQPHGMSFRVHLPKLFASTVMPRYFMKQTKYKSFLRQLHIYGFHRIAKGKDKGAYFHDKFIRNKKAMSLQMTRQKIKGKTSSSNPTNHYAAGGEHPDFYSLETTINVDNDQYQDRRIFTSDIQFDPRILQACATTEEKKKGFQLLCGPATLCTDTGSIDHRTGSIDHHDDDEEKTSLFMRTSLFNQEAAGVAVPSPASYQRNSGNETKIDLAVEWLELRRGNENNRHSGHEELFFGKRFFHVAETANTVDGIFQLVDNIR
jgi:hypothetical protein